MDLQQAINLANERIKLIDGLKSNIPEAKDLTVALKILIDQAQRPDIAKANNEGRLFVLPCKDGDTVYAINSKSKTIIEAVVTYITIDNGISITFHYNTDEICPDCDGCPFSAWQPNGESGDYSCWGECGETTVQIDDIGKTVFLTREEAKSALSGMKG